MNADRSEWAEAGLRAFVAAANDDYCFDHAHFLDLAYWPDALADFLCDLMHWADRRPEFEGFEAALAQARSHYQRETRTD